MENINTNINSAHNFLKSAQYLIISLGTSWVYEYKKSGKIVSNCHKISAKEFKRYRLTINNIIVYLSKTIEKLKKFNPNLVIILTLSPIRHLKDGFHENQLSKSTLLLAIDELCKNYKHISYFPSYEIVMDDLRDYRFYTDDMIHLNPTAINYIWEYFSNSYFSSKTKSLIKKIGKIHSATQHKPFDSTSKEYKLFVDQTKKNIDELLHHYPFLNFDKEIRLLTTY